MDYLIPITIIVALSIIGLNIFLFHGSIRDKIDLRAMWHSDFSKSVCLTFFIIIFVNLYGFFVGAFSNEVQNALLFFGLIAGMIAAIYGLGLKKRWFMFFWIGIVATSLAITLAQIDQHTKPFPMYSLIIMGLIWINLHYYNKEKNEFYI